MAQVSGKKPRIVILGGGFGGVYAAMKLESLLGRRDDFEIVLVNRDNYFVFQPMLPEVISGSIVPLDTVSPLRRLLPKTRLYLRGIDAVDTKARTVTLSPGFRPRPLVLDYDHLVLALGNVTDFRGLRGLHEHAFPFKNVADAIRLRNHVIHILAEADIETDAALRRQLLTFVVAGGGFSGVEVAAELNDFVRATVRYYHHIDPSEIRVILIHSGEWILDKEMVESLGRYAQRLLTKRGMEIKLKARLESASLDWAILKGGERIATRTLVSTVPSSPNPIIDAIDLPKEHGRVQTTPELEVPGHPGVWALGDCALVQMADGKGFCPPTGQFAVRQGSVVGKNIVASLRGGKREKFHFGGLGMLGALGHRRAVAQLFGGIRVSGILAWFIWRTIYWAKLPGLDRKIRVAADWFLDLLIPPEIVQMSLEDRPSFAHAHFEVGDVIIREGDMSQLLYIIVSGRADVSVARDGKNEVLGSLGAGEMFGEAAVIRQFSYPVTISCAEAMDVLTLHTDEFQQLVHALPTVRASVATMVERKMTILRGKGVAHPAPPA